MESHEPRTSATDVRVRFVLFIDGKIVFIHRVTQKYPNGYYVLPGGGVDPGETPEETLVREAQEELNLEIRPVQLLFVAIYEDSNGKHTQLFYLCDHVSGEISPGSGIENTEEWQAENGTHTPTLLAPAEIADVKINPQIVGDYLKKYAEQITTAPFMTLYQL